jgi:hypothetical protein
MQLLFILALLPFIYLLAWLISPFLVALHSILSVADLLRTKVGGWAGTLLVITYITMVAAGVASRRFLWWGLLPITVGIVALARL